MTSKISHTAYRRYAGAAVYRRYTVAWGKTQNSPLPGFNLVVRILSLVYGHAVGSYGPQVVYICVTNQETLRKMKSVT